MMCSRYHIEIKSIIRHFATRKSPFKNFPKREGKFMSKMMGGSSVKRKWYQESTSKLPVLPTVSNISKGAFDGGKSLNSKRINVLNKLFMKHITDLMATGCASHEFIGRGIEISRVQITPDFHGVNVYWLARGSEDDENLEKILMINAGALRHELSQLRVIGVVPKITFVKDKLYAKLIEVDARLGKADFGEDYVPIEPSYRLKTEFTLNTKLTEELKNEISAIEDNTVNDTPEEPLPIMRMDLFGLNYTGIMEKIKQQATKSKALHRKTVQNTMTSTTVNLPDAQPIIAFESQRAKKELFIEFLHKRQVMKQKASRVKNKMRTSGLEDTLDSVNEFDLDEVNELDDGDFIMDFEKYEDKK